MRKFFEEFQAFISRGNVLDLAVAVIIGAAFSKIVDSLVKDIINPIIGVCVGRPDFTNLFVVLKDAPVDYTGPQTYEALVKAGATVFGYGAFLTAVIQFLLLAFAVFWLIKIVTTARARITAEAERLVALANKDKAAAEKAAAEKAAAEKAAAEKAAAEKAAAEKAAAEKAAAEKAAAEKAAAEKAAAQPQVSAEELALLREIRDLLKSQQKA